jgi:hypothetical protein
VFTQSFTPRKKVKFGLEVLAPIIQESKLEASTEMLNLLKPRRPAKEEAAHTLTGKEREALCMHVHMLNDKLLELQEIMANSKDVLVGLLLDVEDELGATLAELGSGDSIPGGGGYVNVWSGIGSALENNQAVDTIVGKLVQQTKLNTAAVEQVVNHANMESAHLKTQFVGF